MKKPCFYKPFLYCVGFTDEELEFLKFILEALVYFLKDFSNFDNLLIAAKVNR